MDQVGLLKFEPLCGENGKENAMRLASTNKYLKRLRLITTCVIPNM